MALVDENPDRTYSDAIQELFGRYSNVPFLRAMMFRGVDPNIMTGEDNGTYYAFPRNEDADPLMGAIRQRNFIPFGDQSKMQEFTSIIPQLIAAFRGAK